MKGYHGIIFAYSAAPELGTLVSERTAASLPFCGRYRLIDFALSSFKNAGVLDVGVIMQRASNVAMYPFSIYKDEDIGISESTQLHLRTHVAFCKSK